MHPAAPVDRDALLDAFDQTVRAIIDLGYACRDDDFTRPTECPGWTVKDQMSHVVGAEKAFAGVRRAPIDVPDYPHIHNEMGRIVEQDVEARRAVPGQEVVAELAEFHPERMAALRASDTGLEAVVGGFFGPDTTLGQQLHWRIVDAWCHEQDIRAALDRPGDLDSPAAALFTSDVLDALPRVASRVAGVEPGHAVVLDVTGPVQARGGVRVVVGDDGRPFGEKLFSGHDRPAGEEQLDVTSIQLTTEALTRVAAGRRTVDEIHYTVTTGDEDRARHVLESLVIMH